MLICKKLYVNDIDPRLLLDPAIDGKQYPLKDYHRVYMGEVLEVYQR